MLVISQQTYGSRKDLLRTVQPSDQAQGSEAFKSIPRAGFQLWTCTSRIGLAKIQREPKDKLLLVTDTHLMFLGCHRHNQAVTRTRLWKECSMLGTEKRSQHVAHSHMVLEDSVKMCPQLTSQGHFLRMIPRLFIHRSGAFLRISDLWTGFKVWTGSKVSKPLNWF